MVFLEGAALGFCCHAGVGMLAWYCDVIYYIAVSLAVVISAHVAAVISARSHALLCNNAVHTCMQVAFLNFAAQLGVFCSS